MRSIYFESSIKAPSVYLLMSHRDISGESTHITLPMLRFSQENDLLDNSGEGCDFRMFGN